MEGQRTSEVPVGDHVVAPAGAAPEAAALTMGNHAFATAAAADAPRGLALPPPAPPPAGDLAIERGLARAVQQRAAAGVARERARRLHGRGAIHMKWEARRQQAEALEQELEELENARAAVAVQVQPAIATTAAALADPNADAAALAGHVGGLAPLLYNLGADELAPGLGLVVALDEAAAALRAAARPREETMAAAKSGLAETMAQLETAIAAGAVAVPGPPGEDAKPQLAPEAIAQLQLAHAQLAIVHAGLDGYASESEFLDAAGNVKQHAGSIAAAKGGAPGPLAAALTAAFRKAVVAAGDVGALGRDRATNRVVARDKLRFALPLVAALVEILGGQAEWLRREIVRVRPPEIKEKDI